MTTRRAILVSQEQRDGLAAVDDAHGSFRIRQVLASWDAAGEQPRIPYCVTHGYPLLPGSPRTWCAFSEQYSPTPPCRVVDAIVCVVES